MKKRFIKWINPSFDDNGYAYIKNKFYGWKCDHHKNLKLGKDVDIGCFTYINAKYGVIIGDNVQIGSHCSIYSHNTENGTHGPVVIGRNTRIGTHTSILPNVTIKEGSKIRWYSKIKQ